MAIEISRKGETMPTVKVNNIHMYYESYGKGEPVVFINGAGAHTEMLKRLIPIYSRDFQVILFDSRGVGKTDSPDEGYTTPNMADDLAGLLDAMGIDSAHIHGTSMGGMVAQEFALRHPNKVKSLILAVTCCIGSHSILPEFTELVQRESQTPKAIGEAMLRLFITERFIEKQPELFQQILAFTEEHPFSQNSLKKHLQAISNHDTHDRLPDISAPTLIIAGGADRITPVEHSNILHSRIPNSEMTVFKGAGHMLVEAGIEPHQIALAFFKRHPATQG